MHDTHASVFQKVMQTAQQDPKFIGSNGLQSYIKAFKKEFYTTRKPSGLILFFIWEKWASVGAFSR